LSYNDCGDMPLGSGVRDLSDEEAISVWLIS